jgi:hypothetical protein
MPSTELQPTRDEVSDTAAGSRQLLWQLYQAADGLLGGGWCCPYHAPGRHPVLCLVIICSRGQTSNA